MDTDDKWVAPVHELFLVAIEPPSSVERAILDFEREIARELDLASPLALGALIPLGWSAREPAKPLGRVEGGPFVSGGLEVAADSLFLAVSGPDIRAPAGADADPGLFAPRRGVFLAALGELPPEPGAPERALRLAPPRLSWSASSLVCRSIRYAEKERWWRFVAWEERWSVKLRRARPGSGAEDPPVRATWPETRS